VVFIIILIWEKINGMSFLSSEALKTCFKGEGLSGDLSGTLLTSRIQKDFDGATKMLNDLSIQTLKLLRGSYFK